MSSAFKFGFNLAEEGHPCMTAIKCPHCGRRYGYCSELEADLLKEKNSMLNRSSLNSASSSKRSAQAGGLPFFKAENAGTDPRTLSILMARAEKDRWGNNSVVLKIRVNGQLYLWQPNEKNPNFDALIEILGSDESKWAGSEVLVFIEQDEMTERYFLRVKAKEKGRK